MTTISSPLHVTDLVNMRNIIDVALSRGAFKGDEIGAVADVYNKLSSFIDTVANAVEESEGTEEVSSDETVEEAKEEAGE